MMNTLQVLFRKRKKFLMGQSILDTWRESNFNNKPLISQLSCMYSAIQGSFKSQANGKLSSSVKVKSAESKTFAAAKGFCPELKFYA